jgi:hypothetical protein
MVQHGQSYEGPSPVASKTTRRAVVGWTAKFAAGVLATAIPVGHFAQSAQAQDEDGEVILIGNGAQVSARPGSATARGAAAEAVAGRGAARVQAAAALAEADSDEGAIAQGAAAVAVANPDQGAVAQGASAVASAASEDDVADAPQAAPQAAPQVAAPAAPAVGGGRARGGGRAARGTRAGRAGRGGRAGGGRRVRGGDRAARRAARAGAGGEGRGRRDRAASLPSAGVGQLDANSLPSLFTIASAVAALGAVVLRDRGETAQPAEVVANNG